jgi:pimeloyl-ACP methyl ester carboxylesterase
VTDDSGRAPKSVTFNQNQRSRSVGTTGHVQTESAVNFARNTHGESYRAILEGRLGASGVNEAIRESKYFFRDEVGAVLEFRLGPEVAARIRQPVLCIEGGSQPAHLKEMSGQISRRTVELLPQADVVIIPHVNHALPLQDPDAVARAIASFIHGRSSPG